MIIDCHVHCGKTDSTAPQAYEEIAPEFDKAGVDAAVCFSPVMEIYDRHNPEFTDDPNWQKRRRDSREYLLSLGGKPHKIYPFYFAWNDFSTENIEKYCGIKWHRHADEPVYQYENPECKKMLDTVRNLGLPILIEETYENTMLMVDGLGKEIPFIIPHLGYLNGGIQRLLDEDFWKRDNTFADMSGGAPAVENIRAFLDKYGPERLLFGSDYPFSTPADCKQQILELNLPVEDEKLVLGGNIMRLMKNAL